MTDWGSGPDSILRGLFGSLQSASSEGFGAANMWNAFKAGAYNQAESMLNVTSPTPPTDAQIQDAADMLTAHVTIMDMNRYVAQAGQWLRAKQNLQSLGPNDQITGNEIFTPTWSTTADNPAVPTRYRIKVLRDITVHGFTAINRQEWASYELGGVLTNITDALNTANQLFNQADYNSRADINQVLEYQIEAV